MRIEIMIDKEQKISRQHCNLLNPSFTEICALSIKKRQSAYVREALTAWS